MYLVEKIMEKYEKELEDLGVSIVRPDYGDVKGFFLKIPNGRISSYILPIVVIDDHKLYRNKLREDEEIEKIMYEFYIKHKDFWEYRMFYKTKIPSGRLYLNNGNMEAGINISNKGLIKEIKMLVECLESLIDGSND